MSKSPIQLQDEYNEKANANEAHYVELRTTVERKLQLVMMLRGAMDSFELKLERSVAELGAELDTIKDNFK